ncbi:hypothetical protein SAMN02910355_1844 [Terrisporobacter glycolicus]|nr:hypothetical protein SAMN02910355_1844 [Terrisporobacter glycolicus]
MVNMMLIYDNYLNPIGILSNQGLNPMSPFFEDKFIQELDTGADTLEFKTLNNNYTSNKLKVGNYVGFKFQGKVKLFQILEVTDTHEGENKEIEIYGEIVGLELLNDYSDTFTIEGNAKLFFDTILADTRWRLRYMSSTLENNIQKIEYKEMKSVYTIIQENLEVFGGLEIEFSVGYSGNRITGFYIDVYANGERGRLTEKRFTFNESMKLLQRKYSFDKFCTAVVAEGKNGVTIKDVEWKKSDGKPTNKPAGSMYLVDEDANQLYNRNGNYIVGKYSNNECESKETLCEEAWNYLQENKEPRVEYKCDVALVTEQYEDLYIGDTNYIIDYEWVPRIYLSCRVRVLEISFTDPSQNKVIFSNFKELTSRIRTNQIDIDEEVIQGIIDRNFPINSDKILDGAITNGKIDPAYVEVITADVVDASIVITETLIAENVAILDAKIDNLDVATLTSDMAIIKNLVGGNITIENIGSLILTSKKVTVEDAFIKNAMIDSVSAAKINTGILNTNLVNIQSGDGSLTLNGTLQQFKDENGKVRIQMGKDAQGHFTFGVFDTTGTGTLIDSNGITEKAISNGLIVNSMVNENANISGGKLDIDSVITEVNNGTSTIKGSKIKLNEQNQTLDVAFNSMTTTVTEQGKAVGSHTTSINVMKGQIGTLISDTTIMEDGQKVTVKDAYSRLNQTVGEFSVSLKNVETDFKNMEIGGANILDNADFRHDKDKWSNSHGCNLYVMQSSSPAALALNDKLMKIQIATGQTYAMMTQTQTLVVGQQYTASGYFFLDSEYNTAKPGIRVYYNNNGWNAIRTDCLMTAEQIGKWVKITCTFTPNSIYPETVITFGLNGNPGQFCYVTLPQLEKGTVATDFSVKPKDIVNDFNDMVIGARNLVSNSAPSSISGWSLNTTTNWSYALVDCSNATRGKAIRCTNINKASGGVYTFPIKKDELINGETYTLSVMMRASNSNIKMTVRHEQMMDSSMISIGTAWKLVTTTSKVDTTKTSKGIIFYVDMNTINPGDWFEIHSVMFEKSTKPSNYMEAPEDVDGQINSLGTRVKTAEQKLTPNGLTTIIGDSYITPTVLVNKGYATTSDVTHAVGSWSAKFTESGGYNKLYNGDFKNGLTHWIKGGNIDSVIATTLSCPDNMHGIDMPGQIGKTACYSQEFAYDRIGKLTLSYWTYITTSGVNGTTNPYSNIQVVVYYTDGTTSYLSSKTHSTTNTWEKISFTMNLSKRPNKIKVELINRDTTKRLYFSNIMLEYGEISTEFTPNPNEIYDGITSIDKDGITVEASNVKSKTHIGANGFKITKTDTNEDVFSVGSDGRLNLDGIFTTHNGSRKSGYFGLDSVKFYNWWEASNEVIAYFFSGKSDDNKRTAEMLGKDCFKLGIGEPGGKGGNIIKGTKSKLEIYADTDFENNKIQNLNSINENKYTDLWISRLFIRNNQINNNIDSGNLWLNYWRGYNSPNNTSDQGVYIGNGNNDGSYGRFVCGDLKAYGKKNCLVETDYGHLEVNAYETADYYFGDIGETILDYEGYSYVYIDSIFAQTVNTNRKYQVFLSIYGEGVANVIERTPNYFIIKGTPNVEIGYEIKAKRKGYEDYRLEREVNTFTRGKEHGLDIDYTEEKEKFNNSIVNKIEDNMDLDNTQLVEFVDRKSTEYTENKELLNIIEESVLNESIN